MIENLIVFQKTYDWLLWVKPTVERFSKVHKYSLGQQLQQESLELLRDIVVANQSVDKVEKIKNCLSRQEIVKILIRLSKDYGLLSLRQYEFASQKLLEIGRLLSGWQQSFK